MKTNIIICLLLFTVTCFAQTVKVYKSNNVVSSVVQPDSVVYVREANNSNEALAWVKEHQTQLVDSIWAHMVADGTTKYLDTDGNREYLAQAGYDGHNVMTFLAAGDYIDSLVQEKVFAHAKNDSILLLVGNSAAGKSSSLRKNEDVKNLANEAGVILEANFITEESVKKCIDDLHKRGYKDEKITIFYVYRDLMTSFKHACSRLLKKGRASSYEFFLFQYPQFSSRTEFLENNYPNIKKYYCDNTKSATLVTADVARNWDYTISDEQRGEMLRYVWQFAKDNNLCERDIVSLLFFR